MSLYSCIKMNKVGELHKFNNFNEKLTMGNRFYPIEHAIHYDSVDCFNYLLDNTNLKVCDRLMELAVISHNNYYFGKLIDKDIDPISGINIALSKKFYNLDKLKQLLSHENAKHCPTKLTLLFTNLKDLNVINALFDSGAEFREEDIMADVIDHKKSDLVKLLIDKGCNVNTKNTCSYFTYTPLARACRIGNEKIVKLLLDNGAQVDLESEMYYYDGNRKIILSPLMTVIMMKSVGGYKYNVNTGIKLASLLVNNDADVNYKTVVGEWITTHTIYTEKGSTTNHIVQKNKESMTMMRMAVLTSNPKMIEFLLDRGCILDRSYLSDATENANYYRNVSDKEIAGILKIFMRIHGPSVVNDCINGMPLSFHLIEIGLEDSIVAIKEHIVPSKNEKGQTQLERAIEKCQNKSVSALIYIGKPDVNKIEIYDNLRPHTQIRYILNLIYEVHNIKFKTIDKQLKDMIKYIREHKEEDNDNELDKLIRIYNL